MICDPTPTHCLPLNAPHATLELVGGKGRSLSVLAHAGFPVPSGFHITTAAYECFLVTNKSSDQIPKSTSGAQDPHLQEQVSASIQELFETGEFPNEVA